MRDPPNPLKSSRLKLFLQCVLRNGRVSMGSNLSRRRRRYRTNPRTESRNLSRRRRGRIYDTQEPHANWFGHYIPQETDFWTDYVSFEEDSMYDSQELSSRFVKGADFQESRNMTTDQEKCYDPLDPTLTFAEDDDLDFLCMDYKSLRAKLSCGHSCTPMSLTDWCRWLLKEGECTFVCGQTDCDVEWPFEEVCKMALLTPEEVEEFEKKMFDNAAKDFLDVKVCPGCNSRVVRSNLDNLSVECTVCTAEKNRTFTFCWQCLNEWKGPAPRSDRCENEDCQNPVDILKNCPDIKFEDVLGVTGCPSIRACPTCGLLVEHNKTQCKNIVCRRCKVEFCFVCLKLTEKCQELSQDDLDEDIFSYYDPCTTGVAPRQTSIPVWY